MICHLPFHSSNFLVKGSDPFVITWVRRSMRLTVVLPRATPVASAMISISSPPGRGITILLRVGRVIISYGHITFVPRSSSGRHDSDEPESRSKSKKLHPLSGSTRTGEKNASPLVQIYLDRGAKAKMHPSPKPTRVGEQSTTFQLTRLRGKRKNSTPSHSKPV